MTRDAQSLIPRIFIRIRLSCAFYTRRCFSGGRCAGLDLRTGSHFLFEAEGARWFRTGDVANIDSDGFLQITDRAKDLIKSGGEWISSIDLENVAMSHPDVAQAAAIAMPHPKWLERPMLVVIPREGAAPDKAEILDFLADKVAKWWLPDDVVFVEAFPMTATGKVSKARLRERFKDHRLPTA